MSSLVAGGMALAVLNPRARVQELEKVGAYLKEHGPFLGGEAPNAADASLAPKLYHAKHALKHFKARPARCMF